MSGEALLSGESCWAVGRKWANELLNLVPFLTQKPEVMPEVPQKLDLNAVPIEPTFIPLQAMAILLLVFGPTEIVRLTEKGERAILIRLLLVLWSWLKEFD
jgi:hypothetical protein